jgi:glutathione peroxidase
MAAKSLKRKFKNVLIVLLMIFIVFWGYVELMNRNSHNMSARQKLLKAVYPVWMWWGKIRGKNNAEFTNAKEQPQVSFYSLKSVLNDGTMMDFASLAGKKVLLVNTASNCGYTDQYNQLQELAETYSKDLVVIAFPANDFKHQEKGSDEEIAEFCKANYGISFPLMKKSSVIKGPGQHEVFQWLTDSSKNGWNSKPPSWNFSKYLVNERGVLTNYFGATVSPLSKEVLDAINKKE